MRCMKSRGEKSLCNLNLNSIKVSAQTASLTLGGNSYEDDESIFTFRDRDSLPTSIASTNDTCSKRTKGMKYFNN